MNEKLSFQSIADALAKKAGVQKKVADTFSKAFFDTIVEALVAGETLKIKGLGTFKLVEVDDRESVNVSTGKRFVIPGYKKVAFTAEDKVLEVLNERTESEVVKEEKEEPVKEEKPVPVKKEKAVVKEKKTEEKPVAKEEKPVVKEEKPVVKEEKPVEIEELIQVPEPEKVETPQNAFAGIDMLISTPESVEEIRQQYEEAKVKMETAVEEARKANAEKIRLEKLLERLEKNVEPEVAGRTEITDNTDKVEEEISAVSAGNKTEEPVREEAKRQEAFQRVMTEQPTYQEPEPPKKKMSKKRLWLTILIIFLVAILGIFIYLIHQNIEAVEKVRPVEKVEKPAKPAKPTKPAAPKVDKDSLTKVQKADSIKVEPKKEEAKKPEVKKPEEAQQPERPKTHRMQRGESLTRISQKYYGTKDSVRAILRINTFANPDNIPVGAVVKLP